jgi:hypothetical protein
MPRDWKSLITDPRDRKVFEALADPSWDFRTVEGVARSTGLSLGEVESVLVKYPDLIRRSAIPDREGRDLYTLASTAVKAKEVLAEIRTYVTKSS